jgi:hypothetical protein
LDYTEIIPERLWIGPAPSQADLAELKNTFGSDLTVMDLNQDPQEAAWCKELGVNYDDRTPKVEDSNEPVPLGRLKVVSAIVGDNVDSGRKVLLHCTAGRGRSPTCAAAYLISSGMSVTDAKNTVAGKRNVWTGPDQKPPGLLEEYGKIVEFARSGI